MILNNISNLIRINKIEGNGKDSYSSSPVESKNISKITFSGNISGAKTLSEEIAFQIAQKIEFKKIYKNLPNVVKSLIPANGNLKHIEGILAPDLITKLKSTEIAHNFQKAEESFHQVALKIIEQHGNPSAINEIKSPQIKDFLISNIEDRSQAVLLLDSITNPDIKAEKLSEIIDNPEILSDFIELVVPHIDPTKNDEIILNACAKLTEEDNLYKFKLSPYIKDENTKYDFFSKATENLFKTEAHIYSADNGFIETLSKLPNNAAYNEKKKQIVQDFLNSEHIPEYSKDRVKKDLYKIGDDTLTKISLDSIMQDSFLVKAKDIKNAISALSNEEDKLFYINKILASKDYSLINRGLESISALNDTKKQEEIILKLLKNDANGKFDWTSKQGAASSLYLVKDTSKRIQCLDKLTDSDDFLKEEFAKKLYESFEKIEDQDFLVKFKNEVSERFNPPADLKVIDEKLGEIGLNSAKENETDSIFQHIELINNSEHSDQIIPLYKNLVKNSPVEIPLPKFLSIYDNFLSTGKSPSDFCKIFDEYKYLNKTYLDNHEKFNQVNLRQAQEFLNNIKDFKTLFGMINTEKEDELVTVFNELKKEYPGQNIRDMFANHILENMLEIKGDEKLFLKTKNFVSNFLPDVKINDLTFEQFKNGLNAPLEKSHTGQFLSIAMDMDKCRAIRQGTLFDKSYEQNLNVIAIANKGLIIEGQLKNKNGNLFRAIEDIQAHKSVLNIISRASRELCVDVINYTKLLELANGYASVGLDKEFIQKATKMLDNKKFNIDELSSDFVKIIGEKCGIPPEEIHKIDSNVLAKWDLNNFPTFAIALNKMSEKHSQWLKDLFKTTVNNNYWEYLFKKETEIGKANYETAKIFKENGLNYKKWLKPSTEPAKIIFGQPESINDRAIYINRALVSDINELFDSTQIKAVLSPYLKSIGCKIEEGVLKGLNSKELDVNELSVKTKAINDFMKPHWESAEVKNNINLLTMKDHLRQRVEDFSNILNSKFSQSPEVITAQIWDRNPGTGLFQGTYAQCCTALDGGNGHQAVISMVHTTNQVLEFKNAIGENIGNGELYWAVDKLNKEPFLVVNNIELNRTYRGGKEVIDPVINYLKAYTKEITGKDNTKIYAGKKYNSIDFNGYNTEIVPKVKVLGSVIDDKIKFDSLNSFSETMGNEHENIHLYRLS